MQLPVWGGWWGVCVWKFYSYTLKNYLFNKNIKLKNSSFLDYIMYADVNAYDILCSILPE